MAIEIGGSGWWRALSLPEPGPYPVGRGQARSLHKEMEYLRLIQQETLSKAKWRSLRVWRKFLDNLGKIVKVKRDKPGIYSTRNDRVVGDSNGGDVMCVDFVRCVQDPAGTICVAQYSNRRVDTAGKQAGLFAIYRDQKTTIKNLLSRQLRRRGGC